MNEPLQSWFRESQRHTCEPALVYQVAIFRDVLAPMWIGSALHRDDAGKYLRDDESPRPKLTVIGTHCSKSVLLPVVRMEAFDGALLAIVRGNFHDYALSVISSVPAEFDPLGIIKPNDDYLMSPIYFEGFPSELVFEPWPGDVVTVKGGAVGATTNVRDSNHWFRFSAKCRTDHELYALMLAIRVAVARQLGLGERA